MSRGLGILVLTAWDVPPSDHTKQTKKQTFAYGVGRATSRCVGARHSKSLEGEHFLVMSFF